MSYKILCEDGLRWLVFSESERHSLQPGWIVEPQKLGFPMFFSAADWNYELIDNTHTFTTYGDFKVPYSRQDVRVVGITLCGDRYGAFLGGGLQVEEV